jgi:hypothetical protein
VEDHFRDHEEMYLGKLGLITHLDVRPVMEGHEDVVDYVFKTVRLVRRRRLGVAEEAG